LEPLSPMWRWRDSWPNCWLNRETTCSSSPSDGKPWALADGNRRSLGRHGRRALARTCSAAGRTTRVQKKPVFLRGSPAMPTPSGRPVGVALQHARERLLHVWRPLPSFPQTFGSLLRRSAQRLTCFGAPSNFGAGMRKDLAAQHLMGDILAAACAPRPLSRTSRSARDRVRPVHLLRPHFHACGGSGIMRAPRSLR